MVEAEDLKMAGFNVPKTVRIDAEMDKDLQKIGLFKKKKPGTLMRDWIYEKIRTTKRNPEYKRWLRQLENRRR